MSPCRVAHLIYSQKIGGSEMLAANVCAKLDRLHFAPLVLFLYKSSGAMPEVLARLGVPFQSLEMNRFSIFIAPLITAVALNRLKIDVLHVHHIPFYMRVALGLRLSRVKGIVFTEHSKYMISRHQHLQKACRKAANKVAYFTTVSEELKEYFSTKLGIAASTIQVICNGVDTERFHPIDEKSGLHHFLPLSCQKRKIILSVGRLVKDKDHFTLLQAMKRLLNKKLSFCLVLVGEGELRGEIEANILRLELQEYVHLLGNRTDVSELMPHADLFALSSLREGLPMVILEAMACGLPLVSTSVGGISEVVKNEVNGFLVAPEDPEMLAEKIEYILVHPEVAERMGQENRNKVTAQYSMAVTASRYAQLYEKIMVGR